MIYIFLFLSSIGVGLLTFYLLHIVEWKLPENKLTTVLCWILAIFSFCNIIGFGIADWIIGSLSDHAVKCYRDELLEKSLKQKEKTDDEEYYDDY